MIEKKFTQILTASFAITFLGLITGILQARFLGPEGRGQLGEVLIVVNVSMIVLSFGLSEYVVKLTSSNRRPKLGLIAYLSLSVFIMSCLISYYFYNESDNYLFFYVAITTPVSWLVLVFLGCINGTKDFSSFNFFRVSQPVFYLMLMLICYLSDLISVKSLLFANFLSNVLVLILCFKKFLQYAPKLMIVRNKPVLKDSFGIYISIFLIGLSSQTEKIFATFFFDSYELGMYLVNYTYVFLIGSVISTSVYSFFAPRVVIQERSEFIVFLYAPLVLTFVLVTIISIVLFVAYPYVVPLVFGVDFLLPSSTIFYLFVASVASVLKSVTGRFISVGYGNDLIYISEFIFFTTLLVSYFFLEYVDMNAFLQIIASANVISFSLFFIYLKVRG